MEVYPKLSGIGEKYLYQQLVLIKDDERVIPEMSGLLADMSDDDLRDLAAYFNDQDITVAQADPDLVDDGQDLYRGGNMASGVPSCAGCHSPRGMGNEPAGYPRLSGQTAEYIEKQLKEYRDGERTSGQNASIMADVAAKLTDEEIEAVASYVSGLN